MEIFIAIWAAAISAAGILLKRQYNFARAVVLLGSAAATRNCSTLSGALKVSATTLPMASMMRSRKQLIG